MTAEIVTTVLATPPSYDLTNLTTVKSELAIQSGDTGNDAFLSRAITQVSRSIRIHCNRVFHVQSLSDLIYFDRRSISAKSPFSRHVRLSAWPVVAMASAVEDAALTSIQTLVLNTDYQLKTISAGTGAATNLGELIRLDSSNNSLPTRWTSRTLTAQYTAGYGTQVAEPQTIPATPGPYTVTVTNAASFSIDLGVTYAIGGAALVAVTGAPTAGQYSVNTSTGVYTFNSGDQAKGVVITYAYNQIPDDLVDACLREVTERFRGKGRDPMLMSRSQPTVGDQRWWIGGAPGQSGAFPPEVESLLAPYRVPVVA